MNQTPKKPRRLTTKENAFVQELVSNPKQSATQAALKVYGKPDKPPTYQSASQIASENLRKPQIVTELSKYNNMIESALITTVSDWKDSIKPREREIAMEQARYIHDKIHGKAKQSMELTSTQVAINIDLSGVPEQNKEQ